MAQCRDEWISGLIEELDEAGDPYEYVKHLTDIHRLHLFDAVMQFRAIFYGGSSLGSGSGGGGGGGAACQQVGACVACRTLLVNRSCRPALSCLCHQPRQWRWGCGACRWAFCVCVVRGSSRLPRSYGSTPPFREAAAWVAAKTVGLRSLQVGACARVQEEWAPEPAAAAQGLISSGPCGRAHLCLECKPAPLPPPPLCNKN